MVVPAIEIRGERGGAVPGCARVGEELVEQRTLAKLRANARNTSHWLTGGRGARTLADALCPAGRERFSGDDSVERRTRRADWRSGRAYRSEEDNSGPQSPMY